MSDWFFEPSLVYAPYRPKKRVVRFEGELYVHTLSWVDQMRLEIDREILADIEAHLAAEALLGSDP
jgi:hypothetical protein